MLVAVAIFFERGDFLGKLPIPGIGKVLPQFDVMDDSIIAKGGNGAILITPSGRVKVNETKPGYRDGYFTIHCTDEEGAERELNVCRDNINWDIENCDTQSLLANPQNALRWMCNVDFNGDVHVGFGTNAVIRDEDTWLRLGISEHENQMRERYSDEMQRVSLAMMLETTKAQERIEKSEHKGMESEVQYGTKDKEQQLPATQTSSEDDDEEDF